MVRMNAQERHETEVVVLKQAMTPEWISYPEAERYSGLSHTTLWRYVNTGELSAARVGRSVRIHLPSLKEFMEQRTRGAADKKAAGVSGSEESACEERRCRA